MATLLLSGFLLQHRLISQFPSSSRTDSDGKTLFILCRALSLPASASISPLPFSHSSATEVIRYGFLLQATKHTHTQGPMEFVGIQLRIHLMCNRAIEKRHAMAIFREWAFSLDCSPKCDKTNALWLPPIICTSFSLTFPGLRIEEIFNRQLFHISCVFIKLRTCTYASWETRENLQRRKNTEIYAAIGVRASCYNRTNPLRILKARISYISLGGEKWFSRLQD